MSREAADAASNPLVRGSGLLVQGCPDFRIRWFQAQKLCRWPAIVSSVVISTSGFLSHPRRTVFHTQAVSVLTVAKRPKRQVRCGRHAGVRRFHWDSGEEQASLIKTSERGNPRSQLSLSGVAEPQGRGPQGQTSWEVSVPCALRLGLLPAGWPSAWVPGTARCLACEQSSPPEEETRGVVPPGPH